MLLQYRCTEWWGFVDVTQGTLNRAVVCIYNGPTNALACNKTLIQMSQTKTLKITATCFDHQLMIIIKGLFDPGFSYSQSGPETYASDTLQPTDLLVKPEPP
jgi:hypothetical protein